MEEPRAGGGALSGAREQVLGSIRRALSGVAPAPAPVAPAPVSVDGRADLTGLFVERLHDYGASVTECEPDGVGRAVLDACARHGARRLVVPPGIPEQWRPDGIELVVDDGLEPVQLDALDGVLTGAAVAIAQSGTIALDSGPDQGRRALTLIPDLHLCVVGAERIVATLPDALGILAGAIRADRRAITFISGPSATADIELLRVQGVHGPRRLEVIVPGG